MRERRFYPVQLRAADGDGPPVLEGVVPYGRQGTAPGGVPEVFRRGSLRAAEDVVLTLQHDRDKPLARTGGGGLELEDREDGMHVRATLPDTTLARDTVELVRGGVLRNLSPEFVPIRAEMKDGVRVVEEAELVGISVVDTGAYRDAAVAARGAGGQRLWV